MSSLTKNTFIPVSFLAVIIVATLWIGNVNSKADAALSQSFSCTQNIQRTQNMTNDYMMKIENRLSRIEGLLEANRQPNQ